MGVLQRMMMKMMKMMKTNMLLEMRHLCSMGMPACLCIRGPTQSGDYPENRFGVFFRMFVMGVIDDRDGLT